MNPKAAQKLAAQAQDRYQKGDYSGAEKLLRQLVALVPESSEYLCSLGAALFETHRSEHAEALWRQALLVAPENTDALANLAAIAARSLDADTAEDYATRALAASPRHTVALCALGNAWFSKDLLAQSLSCANAVLAIDKENPNAIYNRGLIKLVLGQLEAGWADYELRWKTSLVLSGNASKPTIPLWTGGDLRGQRLLVIAEQGFGDTFQFVRYARLAAQTAREVGVVAHKSLTGILRECPDLTIFDELPEASAFDVYCPMLSLPHRFKTSLQSIPASTPYLHAPAAALRHWQKWFDCAGAHDAPKFKVGISWAGNPSHANDMRRSLTLEQIAPLLATPGICWVNLQRDRVPDDLDQSFAGLRWINPMAKVRDFTDTAAVIEQLDLVITVDTALAHLAGALDKATWVLIPKPCDWRWTLTHPDSSPWYPGMRLFRQDTIGDWGAPITKATEALRQWIAGEPFRPVPPSLPIEPEKKPFVAPKPARALTPKSPDYERWRKEVIQHPFWYHRISLPGGLDTPGSEPISPKAYDLPERMDGLRVLDVGARDGYWTFEALRRGAREVVAIDDFSETPGLPADLAPKEWATFDLCRTALGYSPEVCRRQTMSVYDVSESTLGNFDVILLFGVVQQLRHPMLALDRLASICGGFMLIESIICDDYSAHRGQNLNTGYPDNQLIMEYYPQANYPGAERTRWVPTLCTLAMMLNDAGFPEVDGWKLDEVPSKPSRCRGFVKASRERNI